MESPKLVGLLVRVEGGAGPPLAAAAAAAAPLRALGFGELEPLFTVPPAAPAGLGAAPSPGAQWFRAASAGGDSPWDAVHAAVGGGLGLAAAGGDVYVEPDLEQAFLTTPPRPEGFAADSGKGKVDPPDRDLPFRDELAWHLGDDFSELRAARREVGDPGDGHRVRIAHLDTGYDAAHQTLPAHLFLQRPRNFVEGERDDDATDPGSSSGVLDNPGHGTGTLGILAGGQWSELGDFLGGAAHCEVMPLRIAKSVVLVQTGALAKALNHVTGGAGGRLADVVSLSMGGVASRAWADAVNKAYEAGVCIVAAAGNNFSTGIFGVPTRFIVYPARFRRVIAACGVMANRQPYYGLPIRKMQGNWGPASKMATAIAAFTPNVPWAERGAPAIVDRNGAGTSSATPQVAAAAALWLARHRAELAKYTEPWQRVEAVRHALFTAADKSADGGSSDKLGNGVVRARRALDVAPIDSPARTPRDSATLSFLRVLTGLGVAGASARSEMFALEATQLAQLGVRPGEPNPFEEILPDPDLPAEAIPPQQRRRFVEALIDHPRASRALKAHLERTHQEVFGGRSAGTDTKKGGGTKTGGAAGGKGGKGGKGRSGKPEPAPPPSPAASQPQSAKLPIGSYLVKPPHRCLRAYAVDPSLSQRLDTLPVSEVTFKVDWEPLEPGPVGEYLEVIDFDPANRCFYEPVDLDNPRLLAQDGLPPSEGTPQFHQQMAYAVASLTIRNFERALGRKVLWSPGPPPSGASDKDDSHFVQRLRIYPHALREANAYYSPVKKALLFGYFPASTDDPGEHLPGGMVFTCLSHDIVAHETTHALLDSMHRRFINASNPDVLAFHEAFADIVALLQHFTLAEILRHQIARTRGDIRQHASLLGELAGEFGRATGMRGALRSAIGSWDEKEGKWKPHPRDPGEYQTIFEPHRRGAILVGAVFDAFLSIYESRVAGLLRLATGGSGVLPPGAIHPDLVEGLADAASKTAGHVLSMCVRALDYCPPVDITFGEFLRAVITADYDLVHDDDLSYRVAFVEAFRQRGIYPRDLRTLSVESLRWCPPENDEHRASETLLNGLVLMRGWADAHSHARSRREIFDLERDMRRRIHGWLAAHFADGDRGLQDAEFLGLDAELPFEVHALRVANRVSPDGDLLRQIVLEILQDREVPLREADPKGPTMTVEGGCTLVANVKKLTIDYCIRKNAGSRSRAQRQRQYLNDYAGGALRATYFGAAGAREPVARLHRGGA